jgi:hypothetical protein
MECYDRALQINPQLTWALLHRGLLHAASGAIDSARLDWQLAVSQRHSIASDSAAQFIHIAQDGAAGAAAIARDVTMLKPVLRYKIA